MLPSTPLLLTNVSNVHEHQNCRRRTGYSNMVRIFSRLFEKTSVVLFRTVGWLFCWSNIQWIIRTSWGHQSVLCVYEGVSKSFRTESITKCKLTTIYTGWEATERVMATKLTRLTHKIAMELHLVAEGCTVCSSRFRWIVRNLLDTPSYMVAAMWHSLSVTVTVTLDIKQQQ
jgi:hypothetical protein